MYLHVLLLQATSLLLRQNTLLSTDVLVQVTDNLGASGWLADVKISSSSSPCAVWHVSISLGGYNTCLLIV